MMKDILILLNHNLSEEQLKELDTKGFNPIYLNKEEKAIWSNIEPHTLEEQVNKILNNHKECKYAVAQGHFGAVYQVVNRLGAENTYYAHSKRDSKEETLEDGTIKKINIFKHIGFFLYK